MEEKTMSWYDTIRDVSGNIVGRIYHNEQRAKATDAAGNNLGYYDPSRKETRDVAGNILTRNGNTLTNLFEKK